MSNRYKGGVISATPPTLVAGAGASGTWTLEQQMQATAAGLWPINGPFFVEDVFSTYTYIGNGNPNNNTQTITNGLNLAASGGLVWTKSRLTTNTHNLEDSQRGLGSVLRTSSTFSATSSTDSITSFTSSGYTLGADLSGARVNADGYLYASWTFAKQPKFFDIVTWTGDGTASKTISHNLGSAPGFITCKATSTVGDWWSYHRATSATPNNDYGVLNSTNAWSITGSNFWAVNSTTFTANSALNLNTDGVTYVAYLFAHNAGGFGLTGTDNVISCGTFTTDGSGNATVNLGYEPQWLLTKAASTAGGNWQLFDASRGFVATGNSSYSAMLFANLINAEQNGTYKVTSTGFVAADWASEPIIYIAIRRGPMKTPTVGTTVFSTNAVTVSAGTQINTGFPVDLVIAQQPSYANSYFEDRLRGVLTNTATSPEVWLQSWNNYAEGSGALGYIRGWNSIGFLQGNGYANVPELYWSFRRAPGFFDEVCYTGTGSATTQTHNLGVAPELIICKRRNGARNWPVRYSTAASPGYGMYLDDTGGEQNIVAAWTTTAPTATVFSIGASTDTNGSGDTYVAYLFATCPGVSKVGSFSGTGATQTINCGFTTGARFVLIKRTDSTGDWYVWNSASGMVAGTNPYLLLNSTAAQVNANNVYTTAVGFQIVGTGAGINASGGTYIFLAIA